jgi:hypothetical protein
MGGAGFSRENIKHIASLFPVEVACDLIASPSAGKDVKNQDPSAPEFLGGPNNSRDLSQAGLGEKHRAAFQVVSVTEATERGEPFCQSPQGEHPPDNRWNRSIAPRVRIDTKNDSNTRSFGVF